MADCAIYLIISTFRQFARSALAARSCDVERFRKAQLTIGNFTRNPAGHTLGIVGFGRIGQRTAQKAHAVFPMKIVYNDIRRLPESVEAETKATYFENVDDLLAIADCVLIATPFGGSKVLDADKIAKMKPGSRLVNIARGKLIDEDALVSALESGQIVSAGLDVHFDEPVVNPKLAAMENVELLSHNAGTSLDSEQGEHSLVRGERSISTDGQRIRENWNGKYSEFLRHRESIDASQPSFLRLKTSMICRSRHHDSICMDGL